jgi:DNA-binding beta-propeller fold protein YncE
MFPTYSVFPSALSPTGSKFAATTLDGVLYVADVSAADQTLSNIKQVQVAGLANLEEVIFDPSGANVYTADLDNGGIFGFSISAGTVTPLPNSPFSTGTLPGGPSGLAINSAGDRMYVVMGAQSAVFTYSRNTSTGQLSATGDVVSSGGFAAGRILRVSAH